MKKHTHNIFFKSSFIYCSLNYKNDLVKILFQNTDILNRTHNISLNNENKNLKLVPLFLKKNYCVVCLYKLATKFQNLTVLKYKCK